VADVSLEELDASFQVNVISPFVMAGRLAPLMALRGEGVVATVLAPKVSGGRRGMGAYAAPKAALDSVTQTLRQEVGGKGVAVFGFDPGWVKTDLAPDGKESPERPRSVSSPIWGPPRGRGTSSPRAHV
jgi:NAD(P)-dependent dehydrogenase (short-subunit alcohol dehydrogenase family)